MAMVRCSSCGASFSSHRTTCPECGAERNKGGARLKKRNGPDPRLIVTIILAILIIVCAVILINMIFGGDKEDGGQAVVSPSPDGGTPSMSPVLPSPSPSPSPVIPSPSPSPQMDVVESISLKDILYDSVDKVYDATLSVGEAYTFVAKTVPEGADVTWESADESILQIDETGYAVAMGAGTTKIVISAGGKSIECIIRVK